jgi:hypothetical protein
VLLSTEDLKMIMDEVRVSESNVFGGQVGGETHDLSFVDLTTLLSIMEKSSW